jgi:hypothetical protein
VKGDYFDELVKAGVPPEVSPDQKQRGALDAGRVERNIVMAHLAKIRVRAQGSDIVIESLVGGGPSVRIPAKELWEPGGKAASSQALQGRLKDI